MLKWAFIFLVFGLLAGLLGFTGVAGAAIGIAKFLFFLFVAIFLVMLVLGLKNNNWSFHDHAEVWNPRKNVRLSFYCMDLEVLQRRD